LEDGESTRDAVQREVIEETGYKNIKSVKEILEHNYSRGYKPRKNIEELCHDGVFEVILENDERVDVVDEHTKNGSWKTKDEILNSKKITKHHKYYFNQYLNKKVFTDSGLLVNSGKFDGMNSDEAKKQITEFVGGKMVKKYKLRDWVFARQRYWGEPFPIVFDENHKSYLVADSELPVILPDVESYEPTGNGEGPLKNIKDWVEVRGFINKNGEFVSEKNYNPNQIKKTLQTILGVKPEIKTFYRESNTMPQWAGSSWYWLRYMDPHNNNVLVGDEEEKYWSSNGYSVDMYLGGMEHATRHLIYGRFWNIFLNEIGVLTHSEPFKRLEAVGLVLGEGGVKMSKRLGNVVNPDDMVAQFGADTLRLYLAFAADYHDSFAWDTKAIIGPRRFIERVWGLQYKIGDGSTETETLLHQTIKKVTEDYEKLQFNTAVAQMMILVNAIEKFNSISKEDYKVILKLLAPLCPFVTEELWCILGEGKSIHLSTWPEYVVEKIVNKTVNIALQVNGKLREVFTTEVDKGDEEVIMLAKATEGYKKWIGKTEPKKVIVVKNKIVNVIV
jgi:leucyl-tRNA synthetase